MSRILFSSTVLLLLSGSLILANPIISEFMAVNRSTIVDDDSDRSDWIEVFNPSGSLIKLQGWALTDDPKHQLKWTFPNINLRPKEYRVVFASGKNRTSINAPLHTNFKLNSKTGYLALLNAEGEIIYEFGPNYPEQFDDVSFGKGNTKRNEIILLREKSPARALVPKTINDGKGWKALDFNDSNWKKGRTGVGYDYGNRIGLDVSAMRNSTESVYIRIPFEITNLSEIEEVILRLRYEDGFAAFINGKKVASDNAPTTLNWKSGAPQNRPDSIAVNKVEFSIAGFSKFLLEGENILAIQGLNNQVTSSDLLIHPEIIAYKKTEAKETYGFMFQPSPGERNNETVPGVEDKVLFTKPSQTYQTSLEVELKKSEIANPESKIHFTTDGSIPNGTSPVYDNKFIIRETTSIKARLVHPEGKMGPVSSEVYFELQSSLANRSSNLPLIILENYGDGRPPSGDYQTASMAIIEPTDGRGGFKDPLIIASQVGIKTRGSSTGGRSKASLSMEIQDEFGQDKNLSLLGMPNESDWVLWGPYNFDLTLMHNPFIFELSRQIGRYAPRTRFVELYMNTGGGALSTADYYGVYALMEKIDRDSDRVDVEKIFPEHKSSPEVSGGYILKVDRADPGDSGFNAAGQGIKYVYPKEEQMESNEFDPHEKALRKFLNNMGTALNASYFRDPNRGYAKYIDVDAAIDHHLLNVLAFNVDALRLSGYMHIPRGGKLTFGPIWDFDRALGSTDGRDNNPRTWRSQTGDRGTDFFNYPWWNRMFRDIDFFQKYIDRFQSLRQAEFSKENINSIIDNMANELREAQKRNLSKWNQRPRSSNGGTYEGEIRYMKTWLSRRITFMEQQFVDPPETDIAAGFVSPGTSITLKSSEGGKIYYTLDGTDPRKSGGGVTSKAILYNGSAILVNDNVFLTARVQKNTHRSLTGSNNPPLSSKWSGPITKFYSIAPTPKIGDLVFSEIHYHPLDPSPAEMVIDPSFRSSDFEFLEILNNSEKELNLSGLTINGEVRFSFLDGTDKILLPGDHFLIARNTKAFSARYGSNISLVGEYNGKLNNGGGTLQITTQSGEIILSLNYLDEWFPVTDGQGYSLVAKPVVIQNEQQGKTAWRPSIDINGSPGQTDKPTLVIFNGIRANKNQVEISFNMPKNRRAIVQYTDEIGRGKWLPLETLEAKTNDSEVFVFDKEGANEGFRFYRIMLP